MRLLSAFTDTRVLLSLGAALVIQVALLGLWVVTGQAELERKQAEIEALPPQEQVDAEYERLNRLAQEFAGERFPDIEPPDDPEVYVESEEPSRPGVEDIAAEAVLQAQIEALEREAMVRNEPAKPRGAGKVERVRRAEPFVLTTTGILTVSCMVGALILFVGLAISLALLRLTSGDKA